MEKLKNHKKKFCGNVTLQACDFTEFQCGLWKARRSKIAEKDFFPERHYWSENALKNPLAYDLAHFLPG